jgi:hypothetical protein
MEWRSVFGIVPVPVFYTDSLPAGVGGEQRGPVVRILPRFEHDEGIHRHELAHVEIFWITLGLASFASLFSTSFRIWNEARAYKRQTQYPDGTGNYLSLDDAAARLAGPRYGFHITQDEAKRLIEEG